MIELLLRVDQLESPLIEALKDKGKVNDNYKAI
jgi:hypothetical protein